MTMFGYTHRLWSIKHFDSCRPIFWVVGVKSHTLLYKFEIRYFENNVLETDIICIKAELTSDFDVIKVYGEQTMSYSMIKMVKNKISVINEQIKSFLQKNRLIFLLPPSEMEKVISGCKLTHILIIHEKEKELLLYQK